MKLHKHYTWPELLKEAGRPTPWNPKRAQSISGSYGFTHTHSYEESYTLLSQGWKEGADKIEHGLQSIGATHNSPSFRLDVAGAFPHPGIAASGDPACMFDMGEEVKPKPSLTLVAGYCCNCNIPAESIHLNGLALCAVIDSIEANGTRVEIIAEERCTWGEMEFGISIVVKELNQPLDLYRIAYVFCNASMLRRTGFRIAELYMPEREWSGHYGHAVAADQSNPAFPQGAVFIPGPAHVENFDEAKARITRLIEQAEKAV